MDPDWGSGGRWFKSSHPDQLIQGSIDSVGWAFFLVWSLCGTFVARFATSSAHSGHLRPQSSHAARLVLTIASVGSTGDEGDGLRGCNCGHCDSRRFPSIRQITSRPAMTTKRITPPSSHRTAGSPYEYSTLNVKSTRSAKA